MFISMIQPFEFDTGELESVQWWTFHFLSWLNKSNDDDEDDDYCDRFCFCFWLWLLLLLFVVIKILIMICFCLWLLLLLLFASIQHAWWWTRRLRKRHRYLRHKYTTSHRCPHFEAYYEQDQQSQQSNEEELWSCLRSLSEVQELRCIQIIIIIFFFFFRCILIR